MIKLSQLLLFLTILLSPLYILRGGFNTVFFPFYFPWTFLELMILLSIIVTAITFIKGRYKFKELKTAIDPLIGLFVLSALVALYTSYNFIGGLGILKAYIIEPILFFYCLVFIIRQKGMNFVLAALIGVGLWLSVLAVLQKTLGIFVFTPVEYYQGRMTAVYNSGNSLALFLGPIGLLVFSQFLSKEKYIRWGYLGLFLFFLLAIFLTRSRGGLVGLVAGLSVFTYAVLTLKSRFLRKIWYVVPLLVVSGLMIFLTYFYQNYDFFPIDYSVPYTIGDTLQIRYFLWGGTVNLLKDHWLFGAGLNGFKTLYSNQYRPVQYQEQFQYPHNLLLTFWTEMGLFGLFTFLWLIVSLFGVLIRNLSVSKRPLLGASLIAMLSYWMVHGMVDVPYFKNDLSLEFWIVAALIEGWRSR